MPGFARRAPNGKEGTRVGVEPVAHAVEADLSAAVGDGDKRELIDSAIASVVADADLRINPPRSAQAVPGLVLVGH